MSRDRIECLDSIGFSWGRDDLWKIQYENLIQFRKQCPDSWPACKTKKTRKKNDLGDWCMVQRRAYKNGKLYQNKIDLLNKIGFWSRQKEDRWTPQYENLIQFRKQHPCRWPKADEEFPKGKKLGLWCASQRRNFNKRKLLQGRIELLNKIGFWSKQTEDLWTPQYENLIQFRKQYPNSWPRQKDEFPSGNKLGMWCNSQRKIYKKGQLSRSGINLLNKIGFPWCQRSRSFWTLKYENLIQFRQQNPDRWPKQKEEFPKGNRLGSWCATQRQNLREGELPQDRIDLLNGIGFLWKEADLWIPQYENLIQFRQQNPDRWPKQSEEFPAGNKLGLWCASQKQNYKAGKLLQGRIDLLNKIGFLWQKI